MAKWTYSRVKWMDLDKRREDVQHYEMEELFKEVIHTDGINPDSMWERFKLRILFILIGIPKFILAISTFAITVFFVRFFSFGAKPSTSNPLNSFRFAMSKMSLRIGSRIILFWLGMLWIHVKYHNYVETDSNDPTIKRTLTRRQTKRREKELRKQYPCIPLISNHLSFLDIIVLMAKRGAMGFIARKGTDKVPIAGPIVHACDTILVDRSSADSRRETAMEMTRRIKGERRAKNGRVPPVTVFPEGTTTNGSTIITFRNGIFRAGGPVSPVVLQMPHRFFNPSWETIPIKLCILRYVSQLCIPLRVHILPTYVPSPQEIADPNAYAENVRRYMSDATGIPCGTTTTSEKMILLEHIYGKPTKVEPTPQVSSPVADCCGRESEESDHLVTPDTKVVKNRKQDKKKKPHLVKVKISWQTALERLAESYERNNKKSSLLRQALMRVHGGAPAAAGNVDGVAVHNVRPLTNAEDVKQNSE